jgi:hypothetical protein
MFQWRKGSLQRQIMQLSTEEKAQMVPGYELLMTKAFISELKAD